jgi:hypothetical protein
MNILKHILLLAVMLNSFQHLQAQQQFLVNSYGDTLQTGVPIPAHGKVIPPDSVVNQMLYKQEYPK